MAELEQTPHGDSRPGGDRQDTVTDREDRLLPWRSVRDITGISRTTAWRMQQTGDFPSPVPVSAKRVGWWESELTAWKARRRLAINERPRAFVPGNAGRPPRHHTEAKPAEVGVVAAEVTPATVIRSAKPSLPRRARTRAVSPDQIDFGF